MKNYKKAFSIFMLSLVIFLGAYTFISPDRSFSENENRTLTTAKELSGESLLDGTMQKDMNNYLSDQFPLRDSLKAIGTMAKKAMGQKDIGGAYICKDGYYMEKILDKDIDKKQYERNLATINRFATNNIKGEAFAMLVPSASNVLTDKLPKGGKTYDYSGMLAQAQGDLKKISLIKVEDAMNKGEMDKLYYRTDHHWTSYGAYMAYQEFMKEEGLKPGKLKDFGLKNVTKKFRGSIYSKAVDESCGWDRIDIPMEDFVKKAKVTIDGQKGELYSMDDLKNKDKYKVFQGGNYGRVDISSGRSAENMKNKLLVVKDSFANSLVPYLTYNYKEITMIDLRYYAGSLSQLVEAEDYDSVLFIYEMNNFAGDKNIVKLAL